MKQQNNKQFYDNALQQLHDFFRQHGEVVDYQKGEKLECEGEQTQWLAFVEKGCFKYMVHSYGNRRDRVLEFSLEGELAGDFPRMLHGSPSQVTIEAVMPCRVLRVNGEQLLRFFNQSLQTKELRNTITDYFIILAQEDVIGIYYTPRERYELLFQRCPAIVSGIPQSVISSYLGITPKKLSTFRDEVETDNYPPHSLA